MPYTHLRYIAYFVPTVCQDANDTPIYRFAPGTIPAANEVPLRGSAAHLQSLTAEAGGSELEQYYHDARVRLQRFLLALREAKTLVTNLGGDSNTTLKILIAPEFYFRPDHADHSYPAEVYRAIKDVLRATIADMGEFADWLIVAGTVMWHYTSEDQGRGRVGAGSKTVYNNTALVVGGGGGATSHYKIDKVWASGIDGIPTGRHGGDFEQDPNRQSLGEMLETQARRISHFKQHLFRVGGQQLGLEICADHSTGGLRRYVLGRWKFQRTWPNLHLITAAGARVSSTSVCARVNGYVCRCDGYLTGMTSPMSHSKVLAYRDDTDRSTPKTLGDAATIDRVLAKIPGTLQIRRGHQIHLPTPAGMTDSDWDHRNLEQQLTAYDRVRL